MGNNLSEKGYAVFEIDESEIIGNNVDNLLDVWNH